MAELIRRDGTSKACKTNILVPVTLRLSTAMHDFILSCKLLAKTLHISTDMAACTYCEAKVASLQPPRQWHLSPQIVEELQGQDVDRSEQECKGAHDLNATLVRQKC